MRRFLLVPLLTLASACSEKPSAQATDPILAVAGPVEVSESEYRSYLHEAIGERHLERLVLRRLIEAEAIELGLEAQIAAAEKAAETAVRTAWEERLRRAGGEELAAREMLIAEGRHDLTSWEEAIWAAERERAIEGALCRRTRVIDEAAVRNAFELRHGIDGYAIRARGIVFDAVRITEELERSSSSPVDENAIREEIARRAAEARAEIEGGTSLRMVAARYSHDDYGVRHGGDLSAGRIQALREEIRSIPIGTIHGPVFVNRDKGLAEREQDSFEAVLFVVEERVFTALEEVRAALEQELREAPARAEERSALARRLLEENPAAFY